ncbi:MAG TPA: TIGR00730 family Rossman fold protein [Longimicrobium sp.]|nr:TIGR00730 family Rossman fold protein [Longimicrobium sp.]
MSELKRVCVFCGSSSGARPAYAEAAAAMGRALVERGVGLVYGGGNVGLMGIVADTVMAGGGEVVGVIPEGLLLREVGHTGLTELRVVHSMHERKAVMADLADAFVALPGGLGTWEELCEVLTWTQLGIHAKPGGILNVEGYYDPFLAMFDHALAEGFLRPQHRALLLQDTDPIRLLDALAAWEAPQVAKWIGRGER